MNTKRRTRIMSAISLTLLLFMAVSSIIPTAQASGAENTGAPSTDYMSYDYTKHAGKKIQSSKEPAVFVNVDTTEDAATKGSTTYYLGDANLDGTLNTGDAVHVLKFTVDLVTLTDFERMIADITKNEVVNTGDATMILRVCVGLVDEETIVIEDPAENVTITYFSGVDGVSIPVPSSSIVIPGDMYLVDEYVPTCSGKKFAGWRSNYDNMLYTGGESFTVPNVDVALTGEWTENSGFPLTVNLYDSLNEENISSFTIMIEQNTMLNASEIELPDGYMATDNQSYTINYTNTGITPSSITVNACSVYTEGPTKYYVIFSPKGVNNIRKDLTANYILKNNIDMSGFGNFVPIGWSNSSAATIDEFTGIINGNGFWIHDILMNYWEVENARDVGLVAINSGTIQNLNIIVALYENDNENYGCFGIYNVGIIAGYNDGTIKNCLAQGGVGSSDSEDGRMGGCGGICGTNNATIYQCGSNTGVEGFYMIGGIAGKNFGTIDQAWYGGSINTETGDDVLYAYYISYLGGLVGAAQDSTIRDCYGLFLNYICADDVIGGIAGWIKNSTVTNVYIAYADYLYCYSGSHYGTYFGYEHQTQPPTTSNLYNFDSVTSLPSGFSSSIWDMKGLCFESLPDLINARRPDDE